MRTATILLIVGLIAALGWQFRDVFGLDPQPAALTERLEPSKSTDAETSNSEPSSNAQTLPDTALDVLGRER
jgi:hypothetical protein